ncbi:hypothetical protein GOODEAATRI_032097, partial [Goodea atripinnis]
ATLPLRPPSISPQSGIQLPSHHRSLCWAPHTSSVQFGTALRHHTQSSCPPSDSELLVCSSFCRRRHQDTVSPVVEIRTGASLSFPEGLANTPSPCLASPTSLPGSQPCPSDHPGPPSGSQRKNKASSALSMQLGAAVQTVSRSQRKSAAPSWIQSCILSSKLHGRPPDRESSILLSRPPDHQLLCRQPPDHQTSITGLRIACSDILNL